jgi:hypothetical protein
MTIALASKGLFERADPALALTDLLLKIRLDSCFVELLKPRLLFP